MILLLLSLQGALAQEPPSPSVAPSPAEAPAAALTPPALLEFVEAPYPPAAIEARVEGTVGLRIAIDATGKVTEAVVVTGLGHGLDEAAVQATLASRFSPAVGPEGPVAVFVDFGYRFVLPPPALAPVNLSGRLREKGSLQPVEGATVRVGEIETESDAEGRWELRGVPEGAAAVQVTRFGFDDLVETVEIAPGEAAEVELWLRNRGLSNEEEIVVIGEANRAPSVTRRTITNEEVQAVPGTFGDPVRVIQNLPGAARPAFGTGDLILRGSNPADSRVYIDGVEVPIVFHLGGYRSVVNSSLVHTVDYLPGGYNVRYGRGTGGVVDIRTKNDIPDRWRTTLRTDFLDTALSATGPVSEDKKTGLTLAVRRSYFDAWLPAVLPKNGPVVAPRWLDYQAKLVREGDWSVTAFGYEDRLFILLDSEDEDQSLQTSYTAHRLVLRKDIGLAEGADLVIQPTFGYDNTGLSLGSAFSVKNSELRFGLRSELTWAVNERIEVVPGLDLQASRFTTKAGLEIPGDITNPVAEREAFVIDTTGWELSPDSFLDVRVKPLPNPDMLQLVAGVRANVTGIPDAGVVVSADPRVFAVLQPVEGTAIKAGTGLYQQRPQTPLPPDQLIALDYERAWSSELGVAQQLGPRAEIEVTGFYKTMHQLAVTNPDLQDLSKDPFLVSEGIGRVRGMEMIARLSPENRLFGWVSYTLSRAERNDDPSYTSAPWVLFDYDQTHILSTVAAYKLPYEFVVSGRVQYVTGKPFTPYEEAVYDIDGHEYEPVESALRNSARLGPYTAVDLRLSKKATFKRWSLEGFVDFLNVYKGENPEFVQYSYDYEDSQIISGLPFIPSLGFEAEIAL